MNVSVIIPTYNEEKNIERCLKSLQNQTVPRNSFEVIVVDGNSKDRTVEIAKKYADKIIQQKSEGVGGARNDGVIISKGNIIACTDADCTVPKNWVEVIQKNFENKNIVAVYGLLKPIDILESVKNKNKKINFVILKIKYKICFVISNLYMVLANIIGYHHLCAANCAFNRESFLKVGGYRPLKYLDDIEIDSRLKILGKIILDKNMIVGYSVRRAEKVGIKKGVYVFIKNFIKLMFRREIKEDYNKENYS
jgi:glycosyltransferase involved in cell wall biosynthesis